MGFLGSSRPLYFAPPKISQNTLYTLYCIFALYLLLIEARIELTCRVIIVTKNWLICDRCASLFFCTKILSKGSYLSSFISRVHSKHRERFCSFSQYTTCLRVEPFFLTAHHRAVCTIAIKALHRAVRTIAVN